MHLGTQLASVGSVGLEPDKVQRSQSTKVMNISRIIEALQTSSSPALGLLVIAALAVPAQAQKQGGEDQGSLQQARKTFATADADMDGALSSREASVAGIPAKEFSVRDTDKSQAWAFEEFLLYYHDLLVNSGKEPGPGLIVEVKRVLAERVEAVKRAKEAQEAADLRRRARQRLRDRSNQESSSTGAGETADGAEEESISEKLRRAREALQDRSKRADSTREAYEQAAGELAGRARDAVVVDEEQAQDSGAAEDWSLKLRRARAALERRAKDGSWSREQLRAADRRLIERARAAEQGVDLTALPAPVRSKYERALVALSDRAQAGDWSREKYESELKALLSRAKDELNNSGQESSPVSQEDSGPGAKPGESKVGKGVVSTGASSGDSSEPYDARREYERGLVALNERAKAGGWSRERYESERAELAQRVGLKLETSQGDGSGAVEEASDKNIEARRKLGRAEEALEDRARRAGMKREQHEKLSEDLYARARLQMASELLCLSTVAGPGHDVRTKYERAIEALIGRAKRAEMSRSAFEIERDQLLKRAGEEASALSDDQGLKKDEAEKGSDASRRIEKAKPLKPKKAPVAPKKLPVLPKKASGELKKAPAQRGVRPVENGVVE